MLAATQEFKQALEFIERVEGSTSLEELETHLSEALKPFGVSHFTVIAMIAHNDSVARVPTVLLARNNPDWEQSYRDRKLYNHDLTIHTSFQTSNAFSWSEIEARRMSKVSRNMFGETREAMDIDGGLLIPVHDEEGCAGVIAFYHIDRELSPRARPALKLMAYYIIERAKELHALHVISGKITAKVCPLTPRQREILAFVAHGKSDWDIGAILGIAHTTVNEHMENAKANLGVRTRQQAVAHAILHGWIAL